MSQNNPTDSGAEVVEDPEESLIIDSDLATLANDGARVSQSYKTLEHVPEEVIRLALEKSNHSNFSEDYFEIISALNNLGISIENGPHDNQQTTEKTAGSTGSSALPDGDSMEQEWLDEPCSCDAGEMTEYFGGEYVVPEYYDQIASGKSDLVIEDWGASFHINARRYDVWRCPKCGDRFRAIPENVDERTIFKDELHNTFVSWENPPDIGGIDIEGLKTHELENNSRNAYYGQYLVPERFEHVKRQQEYDVTLTTEDESASFDDVPNYVDKVSWELNQVDIWEDPETGNTYRGPEEIIENYKKSVAYLSDEKKRELGIHDLEDAEYDEPPASVTDKRKVGEDRVPSRTERLKGWYWRNEEPVDFVIVMTTIIGMIAFVIWFISTFGSA